MQGHNPNLAIAFKLARLVECKKFNPWCVPSRLIGGNYVRQSPGFSTTKLDGA